MRQRANLSALMPLIALLAASPAAQAQDILRIQVCSQIRDSLERLRCYDELAESLATEEAAGYVVLDDLAPGAGLDVACPMRLELTFPREAIESPAGWTTGRPGWVRCAEVKVASLKIQALDVRDRFQAPANRHHVEIQFTPFVSVPAGTWDRLVSIEIQVLSQEARVVHPTRLGSLDAEEGQPVGGTARLRLAPDAYESIFSADGVGRLRLTVDVKDNR